MADSGAELADIEADALVLTVIGNQGAEDTSFRYTRLSDPTAALWRSCTQESRAFSDNGELMLTDQQYDKTVPPDNRHVWLRQRDSSVARAYETGEIGSMALDRRGRVVLATHRRRHSAIAVCLPDDECRRISRAKPDDGTNLGPDWGLQFSIAP